MPEKDMRWLPATKWHDVGEGVRWHYTRHWGMNCFAGEGLYRRGDGDSDRSGCLHDDGMCSPPCVVLQRVYKRGKETISAVLSYPNGITISDEYLWEIYPYRGDIERFSSEGNMEAAVKREFRRLKREAAQAP